LAENDTDA